jgi:predicted ATPase with chaperone activity
VIRITVHFGPADIPMTGGRFDLAIALGVLLAQQETAWPVGETEFLGELALNGELRPITGALPAALAAQQAGHALVLPAANAAEAALVAGAEIYLAGHLNDVVQHLSGGDRLPRVAPRAEPVTANGAADLADVRGQAVAKRALVVAAAGHRHPIPESVWAGGFDEDAHGAGQSVHVRSGWPQDIDNLAGEAAPEPRVQRQWRKRVLHVRSVDGSAADCQ